jgi:hypothetical protein
MFPVSRRIRGRSTRLLATLAAVLVTALASSASQASAFQPRAPEELFGVNAPPLAEIVRSNPTLGDSYLQQIEATGVDWVRMDAAWTEVEPLPPVAGVRTHLWIGMDDRVRALARHNLTMLPIAGLPPWWARSQAASQAGCGVRSALDSSAADDYGAFVRALVARYGPNGTFWAQNPSLPQRPIKIVELWNEPNWAPYWCPTPDPETYAQAAAAGADGAHAADPGVTVALGGLATPKEDTYRNGNLHGMEAGRYMQRLTAAAPSLPDKIDSVSMHAYDNDPDLGLSLIGRIHSLMEDAGFDSQSMIATEFGWYTSGGIAPVSESTRATNMGELMSQLPRTDCDLIGLAPHTWVSTEADPNNPEHWYGIARPATGALYPTGQAYAQQIARFRGTGSEPAPRDTIHVCGGESPDQDEDGVPDEEDDFPLDDTRSTGSGEPVPEEPGPPAPVMAPRVPDSFFGTTMRILPWQAETRRAYFESMKAAHLGVARVNLIWRHAEPRARSEPSHVLAWDETDAMVLGLAKRDIRIDPGFIDQPDWVPSSAAAADSAFADYLGDFARRYKPGGSFWNENQHLDESLAPRNYDIWSEANVSANAWDGSAQPWEYASTYALARAELREADPQARAIIPLNETGAGGHASDFLRAMVAARPSLQGSIDGVYVQSLAPSGSAQVEQMTSRVRAALAETGNPSATLRIGFGWNTRASGSVSESRRAELFDEVASSIARTNCGVSAVFADSWTMSEENQSSPWDWLGIADPATGALRPSGRAYADVAASFLGHGSQAPPRETVRACGSEDPDQDGDGMPDPDDDYPLDPDRGDGTGPEVRITGPAGGKRKGRRASFRLEINDASQIAISACKLDGREWEGCTDSYRTGRLRRGKHTLRVDAIDVHNNRAGATKTWRTRK